MSQAEVCDECGKAYLPYDLQEGGYSCDGCNANYCEACFDADKTDIFSFGERKFCTGCFETEPRKVDNLTLLNYLLVKNKISRSQATKEFLISAPAVFRVPRHAYFCTACPRNGCPSTTCKYLATSFYNAQKDDYCRGYCCYARVEEEESHSLGICEGCRTWRLENICIPMLGMRKYRKGGFLDLVPRDVLTHLILTPWIVDQSLPRNKKRLKV